MKIVLVTGLLATISLIYLNMNELNNRGQKQNVQKETNPTQMQKLQII